MASMARQLTRQEVESLWGDEGPYSQVQVIREIRILDERVSRVFHYVTASINPTTFRILQKRKARIRDQAILVCLAEAEFVSDEDGYEWTAYGESSESPRAANRIAQRVTDVIARMHRLVMEELGMISDEPKERA
jgi:hypothetical protein